MNSDNSFRRVLAGGLLLAMAAAAAAPDGSGAPGASLLWYEEQEAGTDSYPVRIIVNADYVRIDDADDNGDFVLLDRTSHTLYSVSREERSILVVDYHAHPLNLPDGLTLDAVQEADESAPAIAGRQALLLNLTANGTGCYHVAAVPGLLDAAVAGMADYARVLGERQRGSLHAVPAEMQTPCFLARYVYAPDWHLQHGLPVQEWDGAGYRRALVNYRAEAPVDPGLFELPEAYRRLHMDGE